MSRDSGLRAGFFMFFAGLGLLISASAAASPRVVVTIKPIHSLVAGVMAGDGEASLLIEGTGSPHHYSLRPSDARLLARAELVVRVGAGLETFLNRSLTSLAPTARILTLDELPGLTLLAAREGGVWEEHDADQAVPTVGEETGHLEINPHLWLDPQNARIIVAGLVKILAELDPDSAERYRANGTALEQRLTKLDLDLRRQLKPVEDRPYVVFHDAYQYLEMRYNLRAVGSISVDPGRAVGARRLKEIREKIKATGARCVFREPQFEPKLLGLLTAETGVRTGTLDPLGAELKAGPEAYFLLLNRLGDSLRECLEQD